MNKLRRMSVESSGPERVPNGFELCSAFASPFLCRKVLTGDEVSLESEMKSELNVLFPNLLDQVCKTKFLSFRRGIPTFPVGHLSRTDRFLDIVEKEIEGGKPLAYAGDYLVSPTLEGAAKSGKMAAQVLLNKGY